MTTTDTEGSQSNAESNAESNPGNVSAFEDAANGVPVIDTPVIDTPIEGFDSAAPVADQRPRGRRRRQCLLRETQAGRARDARCSDHDGDCSRAFRGARRYGGDPERTRQGYLHGPADWSAPTGLNGLDRHRTLRFDDTTEDPDRDVQGRASRFGP